MFDDLTDVYEAMMDWPRRLANEEPFFRTQFARVGVREMADVACGTGRHAAMFHGWGIDVIGSDISPNMIRQATQSFGEPAGLRWQVRSFEEPAAPGSSLDATVCLGNSLALATDQAAVARALAAMFGATRPGGMVIVQVLNLWKITPGPMLWQKVVRRSVGGTNAVIVKGVHRCGSIGWVELLVTPEGGESFRSNSVAFLGLRRSELETMARRCGAAAVDFHGSPKGEPYDEATSTDLTMVAIKG